jgi:hypothetical protein
VLDELLCGVGHLVVPAGVAVDEQQVPPRARDAALVAQLRQHRQHQVGDGEGLAALLRCLAGEQVKQHSGDPDARLRAGIARCQGGLERRVELGRCLAEAREREERLAKVGHELQAARIHRVEQVHRAPEQARRSGSVAATKGPPASGRQLQGRTFSNGPCRAVDDAEVHPIAVGLLEVVAQDLLKLEFPATLPVDPLRPRHEPLMERRAAALEQAAVGGVADDLVAEAIQHLVLG